jgi:hypothetical protein
VGPYRVRSVVLRAFVILVTVRRVLCGSLFIHWHLHLFRGLDKNLTRFFIRTTFNWYSVPNKCVCERLLVLRTPSIFGTCINTFSRESGSPRTQRLAGRNRHRMRVAIKYDILVAREVFLTRRSIDREVWWVLRPRLLNGAMQCVTPFGSGS